MTNKILNQLFSSCKKWKTLVLIGMLLTLGVGQMWGDQGINNAYLKCDFNGVAHDFTGNGGYEYTYDRTNHSVHDLGTLTTGDFVITYISWACYANWSQTTHCHMYYKINNGSVTTIDQNWDFTFQNNQWDYWPKTTNLSHTVAHSTDASGSYNFDHAFYLDFGGYNNTDLKNNNNTEYRFTYKIAPPAVSGFSVSTSGYLAGSGTSEDPYLVKSGSSLTFTVSGSKARADDNSTFKYWLNSGTKQTSGTLSTGSITSTSLQSAVVHGQCINNSSSSLVGTESNTTIYYKAVSVKDITVYIYVGGRSDAEAQSVEINSYTPYVGETALAAGRVNTYNSGSSPKFTKDGDWLSYTFEDVTKITLATCARAGGNIFTSLTLTDDVYYKYDGTALSGKCIARTTPTWNVAPASGAVGGSMTASVSGAPTGATITWSSTNTSAATVSSGVINYLATGSTTIKARVQKAASGDYCELDYTLSQEISVTSGATVSAVLTSPEYVPTGVAGQVSMHITFTGTSSGWKYRVKHNWDIGYETDWLDASGSSADWTMTGGVGTGTYAYVVELYSSQGGTLVTTSDPVSVTGEITQTVNIVAGANGSVSPSGEIRANNNHVHPSITATANTNYHFVNWTSNNAAASVADANSATTTVTATAPGYTITANFAGNQYTITYKDQGNVAYSGSNEGSLPATHTYGTATALVNGVRSGYTFVGWYTDESCTISAGSSIGATAKTSDFTLYAKWTETKSTITVTTATSSQGTLKFGSTDESWGATASLGVATTQEITATAAAGFTFVRWDLSGAAASASTLTNATITLKADGSGSTGTATAVFAEDLSTEWKVMGGNAFGDHWATSHWLIKKSGHSTENVGYYTATFSSTNSNGGNTDFNFKVVNPSGVWYTLNTDGHSDWYYYRGFGERTMGVSNNESENINICADKTGDYVIKVDYSTPSAPVVSIIFPTDPPAVAFDASDPNASYVVNTNQMFFTGHVTDDGMGGAIATKLDEVGFELNGTKYPMSCKDGENKAYFWGYVTGLTAGTTYSVKAYATNSNSTAYSAATNFTTRATGTTTIHVQVPVANAQPYIYAYTDTETGSTCNGAITKNRAWPGVSLGTPTITGTSYKWYEYELSNEFNYFIISENGNNKTIDIANPFTEKCYWYNSGAGSENGRSGEMLCPAFTPQLMIKAGEDPYDYYNMVTGDHANEVKYQMALTAKTTYYFKPVYNAEWYTKASTELTRAANSATGLTADDGADLTVISDVAGNYTFVFNTSTKAIRVEYPEAYTVTYGVGTSYTSMGSVATSPSITSGDYVIAGANITFTATPNLGYKFVGWYNNAACTGDAVSTNATYTIASLGATTTLYAKFDYRPLYIHADWISWGTAQMTQSTENRAVYTYTYDNMGALSSAQEDGAWNTGYHFRIMNAANGADQYLAYNYDGVQTPTYTATIVDGVHKTAAVNPTIEFGLTKKSYITITLTLQSPDDATKPTVNIAADAYYTVSTAKGGNGAAGITISPTSVEARSGANSAEITATIAPGYTFVNWTAGATITINSPNATTTTVQATGDGTLTANATANSYTVHFNGNGNTSGSMSDLPARTYGVAFNLTSNGFTKTGYNFDGWATEEDGAVVYTDGQEVSNLTTVNNGTANLYAVWSANTYTVSFDNNSGSGAIPTPITVTYDAAYGALPAGPTPPGADSFVGWFTDRTSGTQVTAETIVSTAGDHTLYARFESTFTVTVQYKCGENVLRPQTTTNASEVSVAGEISAPKILGYEFVNWTGDNATFADANSATTTVHVTAATHVVANYAVVPMVYFKNNLDWDNIYVSFDCGWTAGENAVPTNNGKPYYKMTQLGSSDIFYCIIPTQYTNNNYANWAWNIAFDNHGFGDSETAHTGNSNGFNAGEFLGRGDFDPNATMFIPYDGDTETRNGGTYYKTGCWIQYNTNYSGYKVNVWNSVGGNSGSQLQSIKLTADVAGSFEFKAKVGLAYNASAYGMKLYKDKQQNTNDIWYTNVNDEAHTITSETTTLPWSFQGAGKNENWQRCRFMPEVTGDYIFTVSFATGKPMVNIEYPVTVGDFRLVYKDRATWNVEHDAEWSLVSPVFKKTADRVDTASFFVSYGSTPSVELQKCTAIDGGTGAETWTKQSDVSLTGITKAGVYNFKVTQSADASSATAELAGEYAGKFYVRTDASDGGWNDYKSAANAMTYSEYSMTHGGSSGAYSYYFMRHVNAGQNVKFVVANDYSQCLTDYMIDDDFAHEWIEAEANIRFTYNHTNNQIHRAYISGSGNILDRFLVLEGDAMMYDADGNDLTGDHRAHDAWDHYLENYEMNFIDDQNWVYETTVQANPTARIKLTAKFNNEIQYFYGAEGARTTETTYQLIGGTGTDKYKMRVVYDFKTNRLVTAWLPSGSAVTTDLEIDADIMMIRYHQQDAQQITFSGEGSKLEKVKIVYGAMEFNKYRLNNEEETAPHRNLGLSNYERDLFFISFPFDVKLNDVFGFGTYGKHWIIEYYDGKTRAQNGFWVDSPSNWKFVTKAMKDGFTLKANEGYVLALDLDQLKMESPVWDYGVENVYLYFPSTANVEDIEATSRTINIDQDGYACTINRNTPDGDRRIKDSYWHLLGVPSYANATNTTSSSWTGTVPNLNPDAWTSSAPYVYEWHANTNKFSAISSASTTFKPMQSYLAQYAKTTIVWASVNATPQSVAARRNANYKDTYEFRLQLMQNDEELDHTFISLRDNDEVTSSFDFNYDLCKMMYGAFTSASNLYTVIDGNVEAAGNCLPLETESVTTVPVGVVVKTNGEYTFAMPDGTEGLSVTLLDSETGVHTDLSVEDYTVELTAGKYEGRFFLSIDPRNAATMIDIVGGEGDDVVTAKILRNGILYIQRGDKLYDSTGKLVD